VKEIVDAILIRINGGKRGTADADREKLSRESSIKKRRSTMHVDTVRSVGDSKMDEQHRICESALEKLVKERTKESLDNVRQAFEDHFGQEEKLMDERVYSEKKSDNRFDSDISMRISHVADHKRIVKLIEAAGKSKETSSDDVERLSVRQLKTTIEGSGLTFRDCVTKSDLRKRASEALARVKAADISEILDAWKSHERYDQAYARVLLQSSTEKAGSCTKRGS